MTRKHKQNGFTLIEALFAAMLIGMVIVSLVAASGAFTLVNGVGVDLSTAEFLIEEIRERTASMTFAELVAYDGALHSPPVDISGTAMTEFGAFSQAVTVEYVQADDLDNVVTGPTDFVRVTVTVQKNSQPVSDAAWIRANL
jgi:type II secretory pathway pseudopilin PulG